MKQKITETFLDYNVISSKPTLCTDNEKAAFKIRNLNAYLSQLNIDFVDKSNICTEHISQKVYHLSNKGMDRFPAIFSNKIQKLLSSVERLTESANETKSPLKVHNILLNPKTP